MVLRGYVDQKSFRGWGQFVSYVKRILLRNFLKSEVTFEAKSSLGQSFLLKQFLIFPLASLNALTSINKLPNDVFVSLLNRLN